MNQRSWQQHQVQVVEYERWANLRWLSFVQSRATNEEVLAFKHILSAQEIWGKRMSGNSPIEMPQLELIPETINSLTDLWLNLINTIPYDQVIPFTWRDGRQDQGVFGQIASHTFNHGTYHRGQLRGLCQARGCDDFPETDLIEFFRD